MEMKVSKWGNSLAVRLPISVVTQLNIKEGDALEIGIVDNDTLNLFKTREKAVSNLRRQLSQFKGMLPQDFHLDREQANER